MPKKVPSMPSPFGMESMFAAPSARAAPPPVPQARDADEPRERKYTLPAYPYTYRVAGTKRWMGCGYAVVREDALGKIPLEFGMLPLREVVTDDGINNAVIKLLGNAPAKFVRRTVLPIVYTVDMPQGPVRVDARFGVYTDKKGRALLFDQAIGPAPRTLYSTPVGTLEAVTDAADFDDVRMYASVFRTQDVKALNVAIDLVRKGRLNEAITLAYIHAIGEPEMVDDAQDRRLHQELAAFEEQPNLLSGRAREALRLFPGAKGQKAATNFVKATIDEAVRLG